MNTQSSNNIDLKNIRSVFKIALRYWYVFIISGIVSTGIGLAYYVTTKPLLQFMANIIIKENDSSMSSRSAAMLRSLPFGNFSSGGANTYDEIEILNSFTTYREVVKQLKLNTTYVENGFLKDKYLYKNSPIEIKSEIDIADTLQHSLLFKVKLSANECNVKVYKIGLFNKLIGQTILKATQGSVSTLYGKFTLSLTPFFDPKEEYTIKATLCNYDIAAELLQKEVEIELASKKANLINLAIKEHDTKKGKDILNTIISVYDQRKLNKKRENANNTIKFLNGRLDLIYIELSELEKKIESYKEKNNITDIEAEIKAIFSNSGTFQKQLLEVENQHAVIQFTEDFIANPQNKYSLIPLNIGISDSKAVEGLQQYNDALLARMKLLKNTNENNPTLEVGNEQIEAMRNNLLNTIKGLKKGQEITRSKLLEQKERNETRLKKIPVQEREYADIKRQQYLKQELYLYLLQKKEENTMELSETTLNTQIIDSAYFSYKPLSPRLMYVLVFIVFMTCILSIVYITIKELYIKNR